MQTLVVDAFLKGSCIVYERSSGLFSVDRKIRKIKNKIFHDLFKKVFHVPFLRKIEDLKAINKTTELFFHFFIEAIDQDASMKWLQKKQDWHNQFISLGVLGKPYLEKMEQAVSVFKQNNPILKSHFSSFFKKDLDYVKQSVKLDPRSLAYVHLSLFENKIWLLELLKDQPQVASFFPSFLNQDYLFLLACFKTNPKVLNFVSKLAAMTLIKFGSFKLNHFFARFNDDEDVVIEAIKKDSSQISLIDDELRFNTNVAKVSISLNPASRVMFDLDIVYQKEVFMVLIENDLPHNTMAHLATAPLHLRDDVDVMQKAYEIHPPALRFALKAALMHVIQNEPMCLFHVDGVFTDDKEILMNACRLNGHALFFASQRLQDDDELVIVALTQNGKALRHASLRLKQHPTTCKVALLQNPFSFEFCDFSLKNHPEFIDFAIACNGLNIRFLKPKFRSDTAMIKKAMRSEPKALWYATKETALEIVKENGMLLRFVYLNMMLDFSNNIALEAVKQNGLALQLIPFFMTLANVDYIVQSAILQNGLALEFAPDRYKDNFKYVLIAKENNPLSLIYASDRVKKQLKFLRSLSVLIKRGDEKQKTRLEKIHLVTRIMQLNEF